MCPAAAGLDEVRAPDQPKPSGGSAHSPVPEAEEPNRPASLQGPFIALQVPHSNSWVCCSRATLPKSLGPRGPLEGLWKQPCGPLASDGFGVVSAAVGLRAEASSSTPH